VRPREVTVGGQRGSCVSLPFSFTNPVARAGSAAITAAAAEAEGSSHPQAFYLTQRYQKSFPEAPFSFLGRGPVAHPRYRVSPVPLADSWGHSVRWTCLAQDWEQPNW